MVGDVVDDDNGSLEEDLFLNFKKPPNLDEEELVAADVAVKGSAAGEELTSEFFLFFWPSGFFPKTGMKKGNLASLERYLVCFSAWSTLESLKSRVPSMRRSCSI